MLALLSLPVKRIAAITLEVGAAGGPSLPHAIPCPIPRFYRALGRRAGSCFLTLTGHERFL
jgi:hypothetical protein